jgi:8-oxo-dGTP diphosphatase
MSAFTIRVYGLVCSTTQKVLLTCETYLGQTFTKFPGGGLQYGEGTRETLQREFLEEFGLHVRPEAQLYTTDFYVESAFHPGVQVVNCYFLMPKLAEEAFPVIGLEGQTLLWVPIQQLTPDLLTFETDRKALEIFLAQQQKKLL